MFSFFVLFCIVCVTPGTCKSIFFSVRLNRQIWQDGQCDSEVEIQITDIGWDFLGDDVASWMEICTGAFCGATTTSSSTTTPSSTTTSSSTTAPPISNCDGATKCSLCIGSNSCGWCHDDNRCTEGVPSGPANGSCSSWSFEDCTGSIEMLNSAFNLTFHKKDLCQRWRPDREMDSSSEQ